MIPFRLTARVPLGIVASRLDDIHLDGMLAYVSLRRELGEAFWETNGPPYRDATLPIARREHGGHWYWCVSRAIGEIETRDIRYVHRRFDENHSHLIDFAGRRGKVMTEGGPIRDMRIPLSVLYPQPLTWYVLGDPDAVYELLSELPYIGKYHGAGEGTVEWERPEPCAEDRSVWDGAELMRPIPAQEAMEAGGEFDFEWRALRAPYWDPSTQTLCAVRGRVA